VEWAAWSGRKRLHTDGRNDDERISRSFTHYMNRTLTLLSALGAGMMAVVSPAQTTPAPAAAPAAQAATAPQAIPAKIALIAFEQAVLATNEGQRAVDDVNKKYEPKKAQLATQQAEVDGLKKQAAATTLSDDERASRLRAIDVKEKAMNRDAEDASQAYNADMQEAYAKVAEKVNGTMRKYVEANGYTLLLNVDGQQTPVMWATAKANTDVTQAVIDAYNASSGVAAPAPSAPSSAAPAAARPRTTAPAHPATTAPKQ
jgi:Skp family chaperone for outer membrane proteins